ncbi:putative sulfate exporter family transporter, partial [Paenibacillus sepulcri]|nr:putative sulfate exporter family transporter [Paenibacillus sepulcri]
MTLANTSSIRLHNGMGFTQGLAITLLLAAAAKYLAMLPFLSIMGQLVIAIMLGVICKAIFRMPESAAGGISFSSRKLLRYGIILLGMRLNLSDIVHAGPKVLAIAVIDVFFTILVVYGLTRWLNVDKRLGLLTACGTAICGAAAVVAISPQMKANEEETAVAAATVAILGTIFTLIYTLVYPILDLSPSGYGIFSGATLHEVAHAIAAAAPGGQEAVDLAVIAKLTRVVMLVPVAMVIGIWAARKQRRYANGAEGRTSWREIPFPWFIPGFLLMCGVNTLGIIPAAISAQMIIAAYLLLAMAMAGLG